MSWHRATEHLIHYMTSEISLSRQSNLPQLTTMQTVSVSVTAIMTDSKCRLCPLTAFTHSLSTAVLTQHSRTPSAQLHSLNTAALPQHSCTPSAQPHSLNTAALPQHSRTPSTQPHSLSTAALPQHSRVGDLGQRAFFNMALK